MDIITTNSLTMDRLAYANYDSDLRHSFGVAGWLMETDET